MPCHVDPPTGEELAYRDLNLFLDEIGDTRPRMMSTYLCRSRQMTVDEMTAALCEWCKAHPGTVKKKSLELQIWWRDHQEDDARQKAEARESKRLSALRRSALAKLTPEERRALKAWR